MEWVTTRRPHVDRCATAWLVQRFIDRDAKFTFLAPGDRAGDRIGFDMPGAKYGHDGDLCTFQVVVRAHGLEKDAGLVEIGQLVADLDHRRMRKPGSTLLDEMLVGLALAEADDHALVEKASVIFDALYAHATARGQRGSA